MVKSEELFAYFGHASVYAYAWTEHGMGKSKVSELIGISKATERLPKIREAFDQGQLDWTKARELSKVATPRPSGWRRPRRPRPASCAPSEGGSPPHAAGC